MEEKDLVARAREGDEGAFAALMEENQGRIYNLILRMTGSPEDAMDLSQEAFLNAWRGLKSFQGESSFSTWVYRLACNVSIDFLRREKRRKNISMAISLDDEEGRQVEIPDGRRTPEQEYERLELREAVQRGLLALSEEHRQILIMREINGMSYAEIGEILGLESGTVKSRIFRARLALRKILEETGNLSGEVSSIG